MAFFKQIRGAFLILAAAQAATAQMPHRVAVLVNENSPASKKAAHVFASLHSVPGRNLIYLDIPASMTAGRAECSPEEFREQIYNPAQKELEARGLSGQIHSWVYSVDFPIRVKTASSDLKQMSLMGMTFTRGEVPDLDLVETGQFVSPLFAGPGTEGGPSAPPRSFEVFSASLKEKMPLPSMMLGYIGENGNTVEAVLRSIENGVRARQTGRGAKVLLVKTDDTPRSAPREWQFSAVQDEAARRNRTVVISTNRPPEKMTLLGVMTGSENVNPSEFGTFAPGAMADHFTSWAADFQRPQTKCTEWIEAGATVTAGTVTEPRNYWSKFPHARFFVHYASGCSAMESFYQSIGSPMQILLLGNPLSQIAVLPVEIKVTGLRPEISSDLQAAFVAEAKFPVSVPVFYSALLNGKEIKKPSGVTLIELPFDEMGDGYHEVRVIAQAVAPVSPGGFKDFSFVVNKKGRSLTITGLSSGEPGQVVVQAKASGEESPREIRLIWNGRELDRQPYADTVSLSFHEQVVGEGPHRVQAVAVYEDGMQVRSEPHRFGIQFNNADR